MWPYAAVPYTNTSTTTASQSFLLDNIETKKVRVGDIDIAYKIFGKGKPLLLIPGFSMTMDMWLHTIIVFDNRGIGQTAAGNDPQKFSIPQFANDTAGFLAALKLVGSSNNNNNQTIDIPGLSLVDLLLKNLLLLIQIK